jgi:hypothetical protein
MPKVTIQQTNFTAGELTPKMRGRTDVARYNNGAKRMENCWPEVWGGGVRRWGTAFEAAAKLANQRARLIPFIFSRTQAYILEFGHLYMRVFKPEGQVLAGGGPAVFEIATPYTEDMLSAIDYTQSADTMFLWHQGVFPQRLRRLADDRWVMDASPFDPLPFDEIGHRPSTTLNLSDTAVGTGHAFTAGADAFYSSDVGREITAGSGVGVITAVGSPTVCTVTITTPFDSPNYSAFQWRLIGSPRGPITPSITGPVGAGITLQSAVVVTPILGPALAITGLSWGGGLVVVAVAGHGLTTGETAIISGCIPDAYNGTYVVTVLDAANFNYSKTLDPGAASTLGTSTRVISSASATANIFRAQDVGSFVRINGGLVRITVYDSATQVRGTVEQELSSTVTAPSDAWSLEAPVWNALDGYPATGTFFQQRLLCGGSPAFPQTIWGSVTGQAFSFMIGVNDNDAFAYALASDNLNPIIFLTAMESLVILTYGGEFTAEGGIEKPITPTNIRVKPRSNFGCEQVRPVRIGNEQLFVQRTGRAVRAIGYSEELGRWAAPDMSVLAEHLVRAGVIATTWQEEPGKLIFVVRNDGVLATATYDRDQDVTGWAPQTTDGAFESVATIPNGDSDQTWCIVRRTVGGNTVRYVERFDSTLNTDAGITGTSPGGANVWSGLSHLNGKTVDIVADGAVMKPQVVVGGSITLPRNANAVEIGLHYDSTIELLPPEVTGQLGSAQGAAMDVGEIWVRVLDTVGLKVNDNLVEFRQFGAGVLDNVPAPYTGLKRVDNLGWDNGESRVVLKQDRPLPWQILAVIRKWTYNQG